MGAPRHTRVQLFVNGTTMADISDDLLEFTFTEALDSKASCLDVKVRDTDLKYRNRLFIKKGTRVTAQFQPVNWNGDGAGAARGTGDMWVDTVEMDLRPRTMTFKATSISPALEKRGQMHKGTEGQSTKDIATGALSETKDINIIGENGGTTSETDTPQKRADQENESIISFWERKAREMGCLLVVQDGKGYMVKEADLEAQAPFITLTDGGSNIIGGRVKTTNQGKFKKGKIQYVDPKTGKLLTKEVEVELDAATNAEYPAAVLNSRKRPNFSGQADDPDPDPTSPTGEGQPGESGD